MPELVAAVQELPALQTAEAPVIVPGASVWPEPSEKLVAETVRFQPAPVPRESTTLSTGE